MRNIQKPTPADVQRKRHMARFLQLAISASKGYPFIGAKQPADHSIWCAACVDVIADLVACDMGDDPLECGLTVEYLQTLLAETVKLHVAHQNQSTPEDPCPPSVT